MRPGEEVLRSGGNWLVADSWRQRWQTFRESAFRLETLPEYVVAAERGLLDRFRAGEPMPAGYNSEWHERLRSYRRSGRIVQRVRVVTRPLTDYQRRQFAWAYPDNVAAGEDIRVLDLTGGAGPELPAQDFWAFDDSTVVLMHYQDGVQIGRELLVGVDPREYLDVKELALAHSVPFQDYVRSAPG